MFLVGTGPGDPGLLTLRAVQLMQTADVVLYDRLVSDDILQLVHGGARMVYVGKQAGYHTRTQVRSCAAVAVSLGGASGGAVHLVVLSLRIMCRLMLVSIRHLKWHSNGLQLTVTADEKAIGAAWSCQEHPACHQVSLAKPAGSAGPPYCCSSCCDCHQFRCKHSKIDDMLLPAFLLCSLRSMSFSCSLLRQVPLSSGSREETPMCLAGQHLLFMLSHDRSVCYASIECSDGLYSVTYSAVAVGFPA